MIIFLCFERIFIVISGYIMVFETGSKTYSHFLYNCTLPSLYRNIKKKHLLHRDLYKYTNVNENTHLKLNFTLK